MSFSLNVVPTLLVSDCSTGASSLTSTVVVVWASERLKSSVAAWLTSRRTFGARLALHAGRLDRYFVEARQQQRDIISSHAIMSRQPPAACTRHTERRR